MTARLTALLLVLFLSGCGDSGPTEEDMAGCAVSSRAVTHRDVADCAVWRERDR